jgi:hypothetical protein
MMMSEPTLPIESTSTPVDAAPVSAEIGVLLPIVSPQPSLGRIVHYVESDGTCLAGMIINYQGNGEQGIVDVVVWCITMMQGKKLGTQIYALDAPYDGGPSDQRTGNTWHWPERV